MLFHSLKRKTVTWGGSIVVKSMSSKLHFLGLNPGSVTSFVLWGKSFNLVVLQFSHL